MAQKPLLSVRPSPDLAEEIRAAAEAERRPISQFVAILLEDAMAARRRATEPRSEAA